MATLFKHQVDFEVCSLLYNSRLSVVLFLVYGHVVSTLFCEFSVETHKNVGPSQLDDNQEQQRLPREEAQHQEAFQQGAEQCD